MFKLKLEGNKALLKKLRDISIETAEMVNAEINASGKKIQADAEQAAPNDTGFLVGSIRWEEGKMETQVEVGMHYAPYVEFGTGGMVSVPNGLEDYAMKFKGKGVRKVNLPPRPFLFPAAFAEYPKMIERINKGLKKETK